MISRIAPAALGAALAASAAGAQAPSPPSVDVPTVQPGEYLPLDRQDYLKYCTGGYTSVSVDDERIERVILLPDPGPWLTLLACVDSQKRGVPFGIESIPVALTFLAYKPFAPFWTEAEAKWGSDLSVLRRHLRETARQRSARWRLPIQNVQYGTDIAAHHAAMLSELGYFEDATTVYTARKSELLEAKAAGDAHVDDDQVVLALNQAVHVYRESGSAAAAAFLADFARTVPIEAGQINVTVNRAAYLAEAGRHAEALALLTPAYEEFQDAPDGGRKLPGSNREFAWIFACSYSHMANSRASRRYERRAASADDKPQNRRLRFTSSTTDIGRRMYRCMNDPAGYLAAWRLSDEPILSIAWLEFQQRGERPQTGVPRGWGSLPEAQALAANYRELPERYLPALTLWRDGGAATP